MIIYTCKQKTLEVFKMKTLEDIKKELANTLKEHEILLQAR